MAGDRTLSDFIFLLKVHGLWYNFDGGNGQVLRSIQIARMLFIAGVFPLVLLSAYEAGLKDTLAKYAFFIPFGISLNIQSIYYFAQNKRIKAIVDQLTRINSKRTEQWQHELFDRYSTVCWTIIKLVIIGGQTFLTCYYILPLIYDTYLATYTDSVEPFNFPFLLDSFVEMRRTPVYYAVYLVSFVWTVQLNSYSTCGFAFLFMTVRYCCIDIMVLRRQIQIWKETKRKNTEDLRQMIDDHRDLVLLSEDLKAVLGLPEAAKNGISSISITMFLFSIQSQLENDLMLGCLNIFGLFLELSLVLLSCYIGEMLQTESSKIFDSFCDIAWYEMSPKTRRDVMFMMQQAQRPMVINYKGNMVLNLRTFQMVVNSSYSYIMLLNSF